jgi:hypothetical protein
LKSLQGSQIPGTGPGGQYQHAPYGGGHALNDLSAVHDDVTLVFVDIDLNKLGNQPFSDDQNEGYPFAALK